MNSDRMNNAISSRCYLIATPRSGAALLKSMLAANPSCKVVDESNFYVNLLCHRSRYRKLARMASFLHDADYAKFMETHIGSQWQDKYGKAPLIAQRIKNYLNVMDMRCNEEAKTCWVEHSAKHFSKIQTIQRYHPDARYLYLVRDKAQCILSIWKAVHSFYTYAEWQPYIGWPMELFSKMLDDYSRTIEKTANMSNSHVVSYEELIDNPEPVLQKISTFLGVEYSNSMITDHVTAAKTRGYSQMPWNTRILDPVRMVEHEVSDILVPKIYQTQFQSLL